MLKHGEQISLHLGQQIDEDFALIDFQDSFVCFFLTFTIQVPTGTSIRNDFTCNVFTISTHFSAVP